MVNDTVYVDFLLTIQSNENLNTSDNYAQYVLKKYVENVNSDQVKSDLLPGLSVTKTKLEILSGKNLLFKDIF